MPPTELLIIHPGGLSVACWSRLASLLPAGTPVRIEELETINPYWADDSELTVEALADRLRHTMRPDRSRVLAGWGVGGAVADALAARAPQRPRHVVVLDALAPGADEPDEPELLRRFAMYLGARRGRELPIDAARLTGERDAALAHIIELAIGVSALPGSATPASIRRCYDEHVRRELRDHRLMAAHTPSGAPMTVVKAARSLAPDSRALGWDRFGRVEVLASGGDHYSMLTDRAAAAHLAMLLARWLAPVYAAA